MFTKYSTGQAVLIPAVIRSAKEINGAVIYEVDADHWGGVPEDQIIVDDKITAKAAFDKEMRKLSREFF